MTTRMPQTLATRHINEENATTRLLLGKSSITKNEAQPIRRGALGDLGNRMNNLQNTNEPLKNTVMGPPMAVAKKKVEVSKKVSAAAKENDSKKDKENNSTKVNCRKPIRQDSTLLPTLTQINKRATEIAKVCITEQTRDLIIYDPDKLDKDDPQMVTEYIPDILKYLRNMENEFPIREKFLEDTKVTPKMRSTLVNWLVDAHRNFTMGLESLHLCISIVDRYSQVNKAVNRSIYQLVGTAALLLAAKYEEIHIPDIEDFVFICDDAFTKRQVLQMEIDIFKKLDFRLGWPSSIYFLRRYSKIAQVRSDQHTLAKYLLELALIEYDMAHVKPSILAAAACCLSIAVINEVMEPLRVWTPTLMHYTKYKYADFKPVVYGLAHMLVNAETSKFKAVKQKYSASKFGKISLNFKLQGPLIRKLTLSSWK